MNTNEPCAAVFPVDEDFMRLPNNDVIQLEGRQQKITYYLTLGGWNISSPNHIINVIDKFDFSQLDVLVLVNSYHFLEHRVIEDIIRIAAQNNIEIYWARDDRDVDRQAIEEMSDELKVCTSFICNEVAADISTVLHNFDIPIVSIAGVGPYVQKFQVGLKLRNDFVSAGYKTLYISSRREGVLFGARIFPEFLFENGMSFSEKIYGINHKSGPETKRRKIRMNKYELALVVSAKIEDDARTATVEKAKEYITRAGGNVTEVEEAGKKKLAYEIQKMSEAFYYFIQFDAASTVPAEVERDVRIMDNVLRFLVVRKDEK